MARHSPTAALMCALAALAALAACGDNHEAPGPRGIILSPEALSLRVGDTGHLEARFIAAGDDLAATDAAWTSSDPARATVSGSGADVEITALAAGAVTITATARGLSADLALSIAPADLTSLTVAPVQPTVAAGATVQLTATAHYSDGSSADVTAAALWSSDREGIASAFVGLVRGRAAGSATITARFNSRFFASTRVTVGPPALVSLALSPPSALVSLGAPQAFTATGTFGDASTANLTEQVTWTSSSTAVATISNTTGTRGRAATIGAGSTTITASLGAVSAMASLMVSAAALQSITVTSGAATAPVGADHPFTATGMFTDGSSLDLTEMVAWTSSSPAVATISNTAGARGVADAIGTGSTTITATLGAISGGTTLTVFLAPVGSWIPEPGVPALLACADGVKFSMASDLVYVCTAAAGMMRGTVTGTSIAWTSADVGASTAGRALAAHTLAISTMMYMAQPAAGIPNWFRSGDGAATFTPFTLLDSAGNPRALTSGRFQSMIGNLVGTWDPNGGAPQAQILTGMNPPTTVRVLGTASGTVRVITGSAATNLYAAVLGETPAGAPATGGIFRTTNSAATWAQVDAGIPAADRDRIATLAMDPATPAILYAGLHGGGRIYKTTDGGATWTPSATGFPAKARVSQLFISPQLPSRLYAATQIGLYRSDDAGAMWVLAGFQGRPIRAVAQSGATAALILVAADDAIGLYRAL